MYLFIVSAYCRAQLLFGRLYVLSVAPIATVCRLFVCLSVVCDVLYCGKMVRLN